MTLETPARPALTGELYLRRLLAARDVTQALQIATDHVARLLGCPVSWAGLVEGDYLVMGAHHGVESTEMAAAWRLRVGEGIGGRVALERRPQMSRDYRHDSRRVPLMKRLIDNEGIQATLIVPILVAETTLGVLYAAHRHPYPWTEAEQDALEQIAHDLGVRLRQLDVDGGRQRLADRAERRSSLARLNMEASARLAGNLAHHADAGLALDLLAREVGGCVELRQPDGTLIRTSGELGDGNPRVIVRAVLPECDDLTVVVVHTREPDEDARAFIDLCVGLFRLQLLRVSERERTTERLRGGLFDDLLEGRVGEPEAFRERMALMGIAVAAGAHVVVAGLRDSPDDLVRPERLERPLRAAVPGVVTARRGNRLVAIVPAPGRPAGDLRARIGSVLERAEGAWIAGLGRGCVELLDCSTSYDEARAACELMIRGDVDGPVVTAHELGILGMASLPAAHLRTTVLDVLGPVLELDARRGTDFLLTLRAYLAHDRHLPDTAAALHVHYNTVRNRIARIEATLGVDMRDVDDRFRLETALRMHALSEALGHTVPDSVRDSVRDAAPGGRPRAVGAVAP
ncbi:helix-turn-helix domain-containing protein [Nocardioides nitrophenolicus]|uniref:helix-turn-helix domain-containing protein n=1 Tax=Nocardioides nitrophenolicus TaxID=60489 RepID=UPI0019561200|nr:helix-turn-helix domain-containing protein [Nocardioides nitrophenolicus]MBM7518583.1 sugar diacid utilization regulator/putative methionine-R-sulfoxide reductase with GAF domain [Nocardioides nitrophenolicus]